MHTSTEIEMVIENCESGFNPIKTAPFWLAGTGRILSTPSPTLNSDNIKVCQIKWNLKKKDYTSDCAVVYFKLRQYIMFE